ncbi:MAG: hypothetical protein GY938_18515 [Ketobacter sp.]|nr:hypothetical protein [Ketobacter sp.]
MTSSMPKFWLQPHDNTIYIKQQSKLIPCAEIGNPIAANKAAVSQHLDNLINKVLGNSIASDTSDRFSDRWWEFDDEEFTKPMTREGHEGTASLELLLNGLFPVKTKLSMQALDANGQVMHKRFGRAAIAAGYTPFKGEIDSIRFIVEVDAPYFVEGQSVVSLRITESLGWLGKELSNTQLSVQLKDFGIDEFTKNLNISIFTHLDSQNHAQPDGDYFSLGRKKILVIRTVPVKPLNISPSDLISKDFICWSRVSINGGFALLDQSEVFFPFRKNSVLDKSQRDEHVTTWSISDPTNITTA